MHNPPSIFDDVPAWPTDTARIGHNMPPASERIPAEFKEALLAERPDFLLLLDNLTGAVGRASCSDADTLARCGQLAVTLRKAEQHVAEVHKSQKAPHLEAGRLVDAERAALVDRITRDRDQIESLQTDFLRAHPDTETIRDHGVTVSATIEYASEIEDYFEAYCEVAHDPKVKEAIAAAVQRIVKASKGAAMPGVRITTDLKIVNR
jgi:hypothetical protein